FVSGLLGRSGLHPWRIAFIVGILAGGTLMLALLPQAFTNTVGVSLGVVALGGLLVGFGARLGSGCTSGHGICGLARRSSRSLAATITFMLVGGITVFILRHVIGG
ncbi:MAG: YeeE/YedE family protein, partial [Methylococcales bacterium]|nr:YeeE/YedE family protein [Methylococcales bacterium]